MDELNKSWKLEGKLLSISIVFLGIILIILGLQFNLDIGLILGGALLGIGLNNSIIKFSNGIELNEINKTLDDKPTVSQDSYIDEKEDNPKLEEEKTNLELERKKINEINPEYLSTSSFHKSSYRILYHKKGNYNNHPPLSAFMKMGKTREEQIELNKPALELIRKWNIEDEKRTEEQKKEDEKAWELFKEIVDKHRSIRKLFTPE